MRNALKLDNRVINADHVVEVRLDASHIHRTGPQHFVYCLVGEPSIFAADSPEGRALKWWFGGSADRVVLANPYRTLDLVQLHRDAIARSAYPTIPGPYSPNGPVRIAPLRPIHRPAVVAEAVQDEGGKSA